MNPEPLPGRDYAAAMRAIIDAETSDGPYLPRRVADDIVLKLRHTDPDLLDGWLQLQASTLLFQAIDSRDRSRRSYARRSAAGGAFRAAVGKHQAGDGEELRRFLDMPLTIDTGHHKRLADLTGTELRYVADVYAARASDNLMMAAFLRALAKKVGRRTVAEHYTDEALARIWQAHVDGANT